MHSLTDPNIALLHINKLNLQRIVSTRLIILYSSGNPVLLVRTSEVVVVVVTIVILPVFQ